MFNKNTINLGPLTDRAKTAAEKAGYSSLEEFVKHAVEKELARLEESTDPITDQLKGLGYLE